MKITWTYQPNKQKLNLKKGYSFSWNVMLWKCFLFLVAYLGVWTKRLWNWKYVQANGHLVRLSIDQLLLWELKQPQQQRQWQRHCQKTIVFMSKTTAMHVHHAFEYLSLKSTAQLGCDLRIWCFMKDVNICTTRNFLLSFLTMKLHVHSTNWAGPTKCD